MIEGGWIATCDICGSQKFVRLSEEEPGWYEMSMPKIGLKPKEKMTLCKECADRVAKYICYLKDGLGAKDEGNS